MRKRIGKYKQKRRGKRGKRKKEGVVGDGEIRNGDASISQFNNPI